MKKNFKKVSALFIALVIVITTLAVSPFTAFAASDAKDLDSNASAKILIWADAEGVLDQQSVANASSNKRATLGGVNPFKNSTSSSTYYWFLPSNADCSALKIWFNGTVTINGQSITSGEPTDVFADINEGGVQKTVSINLNGTTYNTVKVMKSGDVGTVYIDTDRTLADISDTNHTQSTTGAIMVVQPNGKVDYYGEMEKMTGRGNGTWGKGSGVKLPYNVKLAVSRSLLGMPSAKKWCLLANVNDETLIKNQLTYDFADYIGVKYQPHCKPVDLYVNQQYLGSYSLAEKVEIKSNRINITDAYESLEYANGTDDEFGIRIPADLTGTTVNSYTNATGKDTQTTGSTNAFGNTVGNKKYSPSLTNPSDDTGGYLYELEISQRWMDENAGFCAYNRQGWVIKSCDYATQNMVKYSYDLLYALGSAVYNNGTVPSGQTTTSTSKNGSFLSGKTTSTTNPAPETQYRGKKWSEILDSDSAIRYYWTQEFFKNMDSSTSSTYFYKDSDSIDSKLYAGPMWDMDNSLGINKSGSRWGASWTSADGWYTKKARIYRFTTGDSTTSYSADNQSPLNFYAALATNCTDFWAGAERYWFKYVSPAVDVLTGKAVDPTGTLKSTQYYVDTVKKSGYMNAVRLDLTSTDISKVGDSTVYSRYYTNAGSYTDDINNWVTTRQNWVSNQITKVNISQASVSNISAQSYTGNEIKPQLTITYDDANLGIITLEEGVDYTLSYSNNINANASTTAKSSVEIVGINKFSGNRFVYFTINPANLSNCTAAIDSVAYTDSVLNVKVTDSGNNELSGYTVQWKRNGNAIAGATDTSYTVTADDVGANITATVTGTGNLSGSKASNVCLVKAGERPLGYTRTIAQWSYDFNTNSSELVNADSTGDSYYYTATGGEKKAVSSLYGSVNATDRAKIKWSGDGVEYKNENGEIIGQTPLMGTSKTSSLAWGEYPYYETVTSTSGFENIRFSAKLGGTNKAPRSWKLQYSLDGETYTDIDGASYVISNNKTLYPAFSDVTLPAECENKAAVYIRMVVCENLAIDGAASIVNQLSGDAAVNDILITGSSISAVSQLNAPSFSVSDNSVLLSDETVEIIDNNGGADVYYSINGGDAQLYTAQFNPFGSDANIGDTATVTAWANFDEVTSDVSSATYTFAGANINTFNYTTYSTDVVNGAVASTGGAYGKSGKMTAISNGVNQFVPLWSESHKAFCVSPDDGAKWTENSGFTFKVSTSGYENVKFSAKAYTTTQGPNSVTLQYSTDGVNYYNVKSNTPLTANGALEQTFTSVSLPSACSNQKYVYIRLATAENATFGGAKLHNNASKGNLYINDVVISGEETGELKMPYTNKSTCYFGESGTIKYVSPDSANMYYTVFDSNDNIVASGTYPAKGIALSAVKGFDGTVCKPYRVIVWATEDDQISAYNSAVYYYKGDTIVKFNYKDDDPTKLFADYVINDSTAVRNTTGANSGTLSMYPDGQQLAVLSYGSKYGVKASYDITQPVIRTPFVASLNLDKPEGNGFWLIETSSSGYKNLTLNLEQLSSNNGPRDWGIAYSTNGTNYTYVANSNAKAISNDAVDSTVETYGNLALPAECDNQETLYIKVFINGGETVKGEELANVTKGNTGINSVDLSGVPIVDFDVDNNGFVNAKDYAIITKDTEKYSKENTYIKYFAQHITKGSDLA